MNRALSVMVAALLSATAVTGCSALSLGKRQFSCQGHPSHPLCLSTSAVYALTENDEPIDADQRPAGREPSVAVRSEQEAASASAPTALDLFSGAFGSEPPARSDHKSPTSAAPDDPEDLPGVDAPPHPEDPLDPPPYFADTDLLLPRSTDPLPLRLPAQVMRIWLAPWEDDRGDLHASGYVYTEIVPRAWTLAEGPAPVSNARLRPLQKATRSTPTPRSQP